MEGSLVEILKLGDSTAAGEILNAILSLKTLMPNRGHRIVCPRLWDERAIGNHLANTPDLSWFCARSIAGDRVDNTRKDFRNQ